MASPSIPTDPIDPLQRSVQYVKGVGPSRFEKLQRLGITTVSDLLFHFPRSYEDLTDIRTIAALTADCVQTVHGEVVEIEGRQLTDGRTVVSVVLSDGKQCLEGVWFNQSYAARQFHYGQRLAFSGKPKYYRDHWQISNPRVRILDNETTTGDQGPASMPNILPVYPLTEDLRADHLRSLIREVVQQYAEHVPEVVPGALRDFRKLPGVAAAVRSVHSPATLLEAREARRRFVYEEFLVLQVALALRRRELRYRWHAPVLNVTPAVDARIRRLFPFRFTPDQDRAIADVCRDLACDRPMQRLLQADVGAGKTVVAIYALLVTVANKHQAALMAPTEVLARQHEHTLADYLAQSRVRRLLLTGGLTSQERKAAIEQIRMGEVDLVVGTQALLQEDVRFAKLGLAIVDEQHKFGVNQRARVRRLGVEPHYLVMTATPIPRTVALTVFGDLDVSTIKQMPAGRQPVKTRWARPEQRETIYEQVRAGFRQKQQGYVVCPLVAESDTLDLKAAVETHRELEAGAFRDFRLGLLHGAMDEGNKLEVMERFRRGEIDLLVTTTVIEVGVDVPNANLMIIEHGERFGISQLHQLRGRIGRGNRPGQCFVFAEAANDDARARLQLFTRTTDGFALAEQDLRLRGIGEFFGTRQHGLGELKVGDLLADGDLLTWARHDAFEIVASDPGLDRPDHARLRGAVLSRYGQTLELAEIG